MERDFEAERYYDHARHQDYNLGRFLSPDLLSGKIQDPQSWNRYTYSRNNPLLLVDRDGQSPTVVTAAIGALAGGVFGAAGSVASQWVSQGTLSNLNWDDVRASAVGGAVSGGLAGATLGLSLVVEAGTAGVVAVSAAANVAGGAVTRSLVSDSNTHALDVKEATIDAAVGAIGGKVGAVVEQSLAAPAGVAERQVAASLPKAQLGNWGAAQSVKGHLLQAAHFRTTAQVSAIVIGAQATNVVPPVVRAILQSSHDNPEAK